MEFLFSQGVCQGDPLLPILFNMVMDEVVCPTRPEVGYPMGSEVVRALAYADNLTLFAKTFGGMQIRINEVEKVLVHCGMKLNPAKSLALTIEARRKEKFVFLTQPPLAAGGVLVRNIDTVGNFDHLGVRFGWKGIVPSPYKEKVHGWVEELSAASLKPHQRIELLCSHVIPKFLHGLVLGNIHGNILKAIDIIIRGGIR